jgi:PAS domain S-box-containing protein
MWPAAVAYCRRMALKRRCCERESFQGKIAFWKGGSEMRDNVRQLASIHDDLMQEEFHSVPIGISVVDAASNVVCFANQALATMHGISVEGLRGLHVHDLYAPAERKRIDELCNTADRAGLVVFEADRIRKDGSVFACEMQITSVPHGTNAEVLYRLETVQDVTSSQTPWSPPLDKIAEGMWRIACGEGCRDTWQGLSEQEKERWRSYATVVFQGWLARIESRLDHG